jgi:hypothetical protein
LTSAGADQGDTLRGGCGFDASQDATVTNGQNVGVIYVTATSQEASGVPSTATVNCWMDVNGVEQPGTRITVTGNGAIAGQQQISFTAGDGDTITECQQVSFADGSTWAAADGNVGVDCTSGNVIQPPQQVRDLVRELGDLDGAYCPYGSISGTGNWTPAETAVLGPHAFVWDTNAECTGWGDEGGFYHVVFTGSANDACTAGNGSGTLSGDGPEGLITGSFTFYRGGIHLYVSGTFFSGGEQHNLQYWIDVLASTNGVCSYSTAPLLAHGAIADSFTG